MRILICLVGSLFLAINSTGWGLSLTVESKHVHPGERFTLGVNVEGASEVGFMLMTLTYPVGVIELQRVEPGEVALLTSPEESAPRALYATNPERFPTASGELRFGWVFAPGFTGGGRVFTLEFSANALQAVPVPIELSSALALSAHEPYPELPIQLQNGQVTFSIIGDVTGDGVVDILDLVLVGSQFGQQGPDLQGDVTGDGRVDILDLVTVGSHFGESLAPTAAAAPGQGPEARLQAALEALERSSMLSRGGRIARDLLRAWLSNSAPPSETSLLPNYPNPFNPETWIPYQLAEDATVTVQIYDFQGRLVREFDLGYQRKGYYVSREKALHWDGRNALGERVASGVYVYRMRVGDQSWLRKLVVLK